MTSWCAGIGIAMLAAGSIAAQEDQAPLFKAGVARVALTATVRDARGRLVTGLTANDFELLDSGRRTPVIGVWSEPSPASLALLLDISGSMTSKLERARETAGYVVAGLKPGVDENALFAFDTALREIRPFSATFDVSGRTWTETRAFGATSLWDAIAGSSERLAARRNRRALVVLTDGVDSASRLRPEDVSAVASSLDVPVYVILITFLDVAREGEPVQGPLANLAAWTGGDLLVVRDTPSALLAARQILAELQNQYVVAFEPGDEPGWHSLVLRAKKSGLFVSARSGYIR